MRNIECFGLWAEMSAVSFGRDCLVGHRDLWDSGAALAGFWFGLRLGNNSFSRCQHAIDFTYNYVKSYPERPAPHDLSASQLLHVYHHVERDKLFYVVSREAKRRDLSASGV